jgi:hypothetical protein
MERHLADRIGVLELLACAHVEIEDPDAFDLPKVGQPQLAYFFLAHAREDSDQGEPELFIAQDDRAKL